MIGKKTVKENKKETKETIEQERNLLKITLEYLAKENETLKRQLEDMKVTARSNKELLKEYVEKITNKDKVVEKMNNTIEQLQNRLQSMEEYIKNSNSQNTSSGGCKTNIATPQRTVLLSNPAIKNYKLSDNDNTTGENVNYPEVPETRDNTGVHTTRNFKIKPMRTENKKPSVKMQKYEEINTKEFFVKQNKLFEELNHLKNEIISFLDKNDLNRIKNNIDFETESAFTIENQDYHQKLKQFNLKDNFSVIEGDAKSSNPQNNHSNNNKLDKLFTDYNPDDKDILLFVDSQNNVWELIRRNDLSMDSLSTAHDVISINKVISDLNLYNKDKDNQGVELENLSVNNSDLDMSRNTEMSVYNNPIKETIINMSDIY